VDPQGRGRQYVSSLVETLVGTRMAGFVFTRQAPVGKWGAATYALKRTAREEGHRDHRGHGVEERPTESADAPYMPDADGGRDTDAADASSAPMPLCPLCHRNPPNRLRAKMARRDGGGGYECGRCS
jgi:hypothetical protein